MHLYAFAVFHISVVNSSSYQTSTDRYGRSTNQTSALFGVQNNRHRNWKRFSQSHPSKPLSRPITGPYTWGAEQHQQLIEAIQAWIFRGVQATDAAAASTDPKESDRMRVGRQRLDFGQVGRCRLTLCNPR